MTDTITPAPLTDNRAAQLAAIKAFGVAHFTRPTDDKPQPHAWVNGKSVWIQTWKRRKKNADLYGAWYPRTSRYCATPKRRATIEAWKEHKKMRRTIRANDAAAIELAYARDASNMKAQQTIMDENAYVQALTDGAGAIR